MEKESDERPDGGKDAEEMDMEEMFGSDSSSGSDSDAPIKPRAKPATEEPPAVKSAPPPPPPPSATVKTSTPDHTMVSNVPGTDDEASEDNDHELQPWEHIDMKPAIDVIDKLTKASLDAAKDFNASVVATTHQLVTGCDSILLEIKHISDIRDNVKRKTSSSTALPASSLASHALGTSMLPPSALSTTSVPTIAAPALDKATEDQTDRVLYKIEASIEKFRELAEMIQTTSMNQEALLQQKLQLSPSAIQTMVASIHNAAAAATSAAIAQTRQHAVSRTFSSAQRTKLQTWYFSYPRPLADELELMSSILSFPPYSTSSSSASIHPQHVRDWFKRRRFRERMRLVMQAVESGVALHTAEADVRARMELRIQTLREAVSPDELVRELEHVRLSSSIYSTVSTSFSNKRNLDQFLSAAQTLQAHDHVVKKPRATASNASQDNEVDEAVLVKVASKFELEAIQARLRSLLKAPKTTANTNSIQQVMDVLRALEISNELRQSSGIVADLKRVLKVYKKPSLLRRTTEALMETLGHALTKKSKKSSSSAAPPPPPPAPVAVAQVSQGSASSDKPSKSSKRKKGAKLLRPMKFSMKQVEALEAWFQKTFKPSQTELEEYLAALNAAPLREPKQHVDVSMTQLRRWFNKRRCLRRPPFALLTKDKKDGDEEATPDDEEDDDEEDDVDDEDEEEDDDDGEEEDGAKSKGTPDDENAGSDDDDDSSDS
ncbi:hypothetical protein AC1031_014464 [Aphanomyces cochlioides]|nr:hypothetical protein AC1031_014464 [Aphanomyces cochlioides]